VTSVVPPDPRAGRTRVPGRRPRPARVLRRCPTHRRGGLPPRRGHQRHARHRRRGPSTGAALPPDGAEHREGTRREAPGARAHARMHQHPHPGALAKAASASAANADEQREKFSYFRDSSQEGQRAGHVRADARQAGPRPDLPAPPHPPT